MQYPSKLIENAVNQFSKLPGIGKKTALRLTLHLLNQDEIDVEGFSSAFINMRQNTRFCKRCHNIADDELCDICNTSSRDHTSVCIVEGLRDIMAIENTAQYNGVYHILGGIISPIDGIGPEELNIDSLIKRLEGGEIKEVIMALSPTIEGDTTIFYLSKRVQQYGVKVTTIARGISFGGELEYADEMTLGRSIVTRTPYEVQAS